ncbi:MAG: ADP-ribosylation factor-like protein [Candidatus Heimdallarchaeaceae archaeon]
MKIADWELSAIDVGGQELYRKSLWALGVTQADAVIYVIDGTIKPSSESDAFEVSRFFF